MSAAPSSLAPLPIDAVLPALLAAVRADGAAVLEAPPGAGKTTRVPPALLDAGLAGQGQVVVLEPRRLAARLSAQRVAQERGSRLGDEVGYQVRFDSVAGPKTRVLYVTEGVLSRRLFSDPELRGVGCVVLDEFHERHLQGDLALALLLRLRRRRPDLRLVAMSATLDAQELAEFLGCQSVRSQGRMYPVEVSHLTAPDDRWLSDQVAAAVRRVTVPGTAGHTLVFLPGASEIRRAQQACQEIAQHRDLWLLPLHGELPPGEQDRALAPSDRRKVILSTNVAETSVTVPGVTCVIDSGLARIASHDPWSGLPSLEVGKVSRASAIQRAGRAGRTGPGLAVRLYTQHDFADRPDHHPPEVARLDLTELVLDLAAAGLSAEELPWFSEPPPDSLRAGRELLRRLGCLGADGRVTPLGRRCARFGLHPRLSRLLCEAADRGAARLGAAAAAVLSERELRSQAARQAAATGPSDVLERVEQLEEARRVGFAEARLRARGIDAGTARRADEAQRQLLRQLRAEPAAAAAELGPLEAERALQVALLAGYPDRVARRRAPGGSELLLSGGGTAQLSAASSVREATWLLALDAQERRAGPGAARGPRGGVTVELASAIEPDWLLDLFAEALEERTELVFNADRGRVEALSRIAYGALTLEESRRPPGFDDPGEARAAASLLSAQARAQGWDALLGEPGSLSRLQVRLSLLSAHCPEEGLAPLGPALLDQVLDELCQSGISALGELAPEAVLAALLARAGPQAEARLSRLAPESVQLAGGRRVRVHYEEGRPPWIESRLQDFFGSQRGPAVANGRVPLSLHLLAPNGQAQQVTTDLAGFWQRHYPAVRRELMRRYPRHPWPEDGATAKPPDPAARRRR